MNGGKGLSQKKYVGVYYPKLDGECRIANLVTGAWEDLGAAKLRVYEVVTSSAVMAVPGSDTGELLYAYPSTGISTSQTTESMKMQLRVYLGSVLYDPNKILILPDVHLDGVTAFWDLEIKKAALGTNTHAQLIKPKSVSNDPDDPSFKDDTPLLNFDAAFDGSAPQGKFMRIKADYASNDVPSDNMPQLFHRGRVQQKPASGKWEDGCLNRGHFGALDDPDVMAMHGGYAYNRNVKP